MKILIINGDCIQTNSSANLCHLAYIKGLVELGYDVTVLSANGKDYILDTSMTIPQSVKQYTFYGISLYEKLSIRKKSSQVTAVNQNVYVQKINNNQKQKLKNCIISRVKNSLLSMYGVHGIYATFVKKAQKFYSETEFDFIISISTPPSSHLIAHNLLKAKKIKGKHWIQIWEDPWYSDAYGFNGKKKIHKEEERLLSFAEKVCYVSPLTLQNQQRLFPESAHKMYWQPLPYYYKNEEKTSFECDGNFYGYFGDYAPVSRDLEPFYKAAKETGINVNVCGNPSNLFPSTENINIHPRLPLDKLKPIEDKTNVLIFLCNRKGGQIPGKIYQYSATNKTILFILDGTEEEKNTLREYFGKLNRYVFCENNVDDIKRAILAIERGELSNVENKPTECFAPTITIEKILNMK